MAIHIKPNPDKKVDGEPLQVRDPATKEFLPTEGKNVPFNAYWSRRLRDRDVVRTDVEPANMSLQEAVDHCIAAGDDEHLTKSGLPDCNVLSKLTGTQVTAKMRDDILAEKGDE